MRKTNRDRAEEFFVSIGEMPPKEKRTEIWVLHHIDPTLKDKDPERYDEWRNEDLVPMTLSEHITLHNTGSHRLKGKISHEGENNPMYGKHHTDETKAKISRINKGRKLTSETKEKMSIVRTGLKWSDENKAAQSERCKIGNRFQNFNKSKAVQCVSTGETWPTIIECAKTLDINRQKLSHYIKEKVPVNGLLYEFIRG